MQLSEQFIDVLADDALLPPFWLLHLQHPKHDNPSAISLYLFLFLHDGITFIGFFFAFTISGSLG